MTRAEWRVCVDWNGDGDFGGPGEDVTGDVLGSDPGPQPGPAEGPDPGGAGGDGAPQRRPQVQPAQRQVAAGGQPEAWAQAVGAGGVPVRRFFQYAEHAARGAQAGLRRRVRVVGALRGIRDSSHRHGRPDEDGRGRGALRCDPGLRRRGRIVRVRFHARRRYCARRTLLPLLRLQ